MELTEEWSAPVSRLKEVHPPFRRGLGRALNLVKLRHHERQQEKASEGVF